MNGRSRCSFLNILRLRLLEKTLLPLPPPPPYMFTIFSIVLVVVVLVTPHLLIVDTLDSMLPSAEEPGNF